MGTSGDEVLTTSDVIERRAYVTLLFSDVCDYTRIIEKLDPEDADELRTRVGEWDAVRSYVEDGFGYARSRGAGQRRDLGIVGSAGSAVDAVERERSQAGLPSTPDPRP